MAFFLDGLLASRYQVRGLGADVLDELDSLLAHAADRIHRAEHALLHLVHGAAHPLDHLYRLLDDRRISTGSRLGRMAPGVT